MKEPSLLGTVRGPFQIQPDGAFWHIRDFFDQFSQGYQLTVVAKGSRGHFAINYGPADGGPVQAFNMNSGKADQGIGCHHCLRENVEEITISSAYFDPRKKGDRFFESHEDQLIVGDNGWEKDEAGNSSIRENAVPIVQSTRLGTVGCLKSGKKMWRPWRGPR